MARGRIRRCPFPRRSDGKSLPLRLQEARSRRSATAGGRGHGNHNDGCPGSPPRSSGSWIRRKTSRSARGSRDFVDKMPFTEGMEVKQGDILFELDKKPFLEKLAAATGALGEAKAALNKYQKDVDRLTPLAEKARDSPTGSRQCAGLGGRRRGRRDHRPGAGWSPRRLDLGYCEVKAPITGLIGAKQVSIGELVGKGEPTLLATISTLDPIWFYCNVSEVDYIKAEAKSREARQGHRQPAAHPDPLRRRWSIPTRDASSSSTAPWT